MPFFLEMDGPCGFELFFVLAVGAFGKDGYGQEVGCFMCERYKWDSCGGTGKAGFFLNCAV